MKVSALRNQLESFHPICALKNRCFQLADRERKAVDAGIAGTDAVDWDATRRMMVYGKMWHVLLIIWDELNGNYKFGDDPDDFITTMLEALEGDLDDVMTAMYG